MGGGGHTGQPCEDGGEPGVMQPQEHLEPPVAGGGEEQNLPRTSGGSAALPVVYENTFLVREPQGNLSWRPQDIKRAAEPISNGHIFMIF